jgi:thiol-disulfide isomerase/thioredoxin
VDANGYRAILSRHRGKPVLVNFWATWCEPCRDEYPAVNAIAKKYSERGLVVIGLSWDEDAEINLVRRFLKRNAPLFPNYRKKPGDNVAFTKSVDSNWNGALPSTFLYSPDGRQFRRLVGPRTLAQFEEVVLELLATK